MDCFDHANSGMYGKLLFPISEYHFLIHIENPALGGLLEIDYWFYYKVLPGQVLEIVLCTTCEDEEPVYAPYGRFMLKEPLINGVLELHLRRFMVECRNWHGLGWVYHESPVINEERFNYIKADIMADLMIAEYKSMMRWGNSPLVLFCRKIGLDIHATHNDCLLDVKCPAGNHRFSLDAAKGKWWCGYCRRKGGLEELKDHLERWRLNHG